MENVDRPIPSRVCYQNWGTQDMWLQVSEGPSVAEEVECVCDAGLEHVPWVADEWYALAHSKGNIYLFFDGFFNIIWVYL